MAVKTAEPRRRRGSASPSKRSAPHEKAAPQSSSVDGGFKRLLDAPEQLAAVKRPEGAIGATLDAKGDRAARPELGQDSLAAITAAFGAKWWTRDPVFVWSRTFFPDGPRHRYTRCYFEQYGVTHPIIVDVIANDTPGARKIIESKTACITAENGRREAQGNPSIGYLAVVKGAFVPPETLERVRAGMLAPLVVREPGFRGTYV